MSELLDKLGDMIQRQQELMDQTHKLDRQGGEQRPGDRRMPRGQPQQRSPEGMTPEELAEALRQLQEGQAGLQRQLQELMEKLGKDGAGEGEGDFGRAGREMGEARDALGRGDTGEALGSQGRALEALRDGARQLAEQMGNGPDGPARGMAEGEEPDDTDPLGRPRRNSGPDPGRSVKVPDEIDTQRARRILEDIRRRLSEPYRPRIELDYLERLLRLE